MENLAEKVVIIGSFNFTKGEEEKNSENLLVIRDKNQVAKYSKMYHQGK